MKRLLTRRSFMKKTTAALAGVAAIGSRPLYADIAKKSDKLALLGGAAVRTQPFSTTWPIFDENEEYLYRLCIILGMEDSYEL